MTNTLLVFGYGYTASVWGKQLLAQGWRVLATTREKGKAADLCNQGVEAVAWPGAQLTSMLDRATHVLHSIAPDQNGDPVYNELSAQIAERTNQFQWFGYLSTTGVYGNHDGGWVDEETPRIPSTRRGEYRLKAEDQWLEMWKSRGLPLHIFRLAGIYGPGRGPFAKVRAGTARRIIKPGQVFSRIHVEDIAGVLSASIASPRPGAAYNVCDDDPAPPEMVIEEAARLLGLSVPEAVAYDDAEMTPMARSFYAESKRVSNQRVKSELGVELRYPDYKSGLSALLHEENGRQP